MERITYSISMSKATWDEIERIREVLPMDRSHMVEFLLRYGIERVMEARDTLGLANRHDSKRRQGNA